MEQLTSFATHTLEKVGILKRDGDIITIWREIRGFCKWKYYVEENGELRLVQAFKDGKWRPTLLEKWIEKKEEEEYVLYLEVERIKDRSLDRKVAGQTLRDWYEGFISYFEEETGELLLWAEFDSLKQVYLFIEYEAPPYDEWEAYWRLLKWERENLKIKFGAVIQDIWRYSNDVIYRAAEDLGRLDEWRKRKFTIKEALEYFGSPEGIVEKFFGKNSGQEDWKVWVAEKVFNNLITVVNYGKDVK
jgi:hypothetical protein